MTASNTTDQMREVLSGIQANLESISSEIDSAKCRYAKTLADYQSLERAVEIMEGIETRAEDATVPNDVDFSGARNLLERLQRIAERTGGIIIVRDVVDLLIRAGQSKAKRRSLESNIYKIIKENGSFSYIGPGRFHSTPLLDPGSNDSDPTDRREGGVKPMM